MNLFLTPQLEPFFGGTYFPPRARAGLPGFAEVLAAVRSAWVERREHVELQARALLDRMRGGAAAVPRAGDPGAHPAAMAQIAARFDPVHGGFGTAPKFPHAPLLQYLLAVATNGDATARAMLETTLLSMAAGGIYDHVGGGFARYAPTRAGMCRISRRCCTTTPSSCASTRGVPTHRPPAAAFRRRRHAGLPDARNASSSGTCRATAPRRTPTPKASKAILRLDGAAVSRGTRHRRVGRGTPVRRYRGRQLGNGHERARTSQCHRGVRRTGPECAALRRLGADRARTALRSPCGTVWPAPTTRCSPTGTA